MKHTECPALVVLGCRDVNSVLKSLPFYLMFTKSRPLLVLEESMDL